MLKTLTLGPLAANCYILSDENNNAIVVDPGANAWKILPELNGLKVHYVIFTHCHFDHILAAKSVIEKTGAKLITSRFDAEHIHDKSKTLLCWFSGIQEELPEADIIVNDGDTLTVGSINLTFIYTPGHSAGGMCIRANEYLFTGDLLFKNNVGRTDLVDGDLELLKKSVTEKLFTISENLTVLPGHDVSTTLFDEKKYNPYFN